MRSIGSAKPADDADGGPDGPTVALGRFRRRRPRRSLDRQNGGIEGDDMGPANVISDLQQLIAEEMHLVGQELGDSLDGHQSETTRRHPRTA